MQPRDREHLRRQKASIGHDNNQLRCQRADVFRRRAIPQRRGLVHREPMRQRRLLHRWRRQRLPAPDRLIRARIHAANRVPRAEDGLQRGGGNVGRTHKKDSHGLLLHTFFVVVLHILIEILGDVHDRNAV